MFSINRVTLIGFLGKDAEVRRAHNNDTPFTVISLATNRSWKDPESREYKSNGTWHRCVVFGKASEFAATLTKGTAGQIEGVLKTRQYTPNDSDAKKSITEVRVYRISKLDRPAKAGRTQSATYPLKPARATIGAESDDVSTATPAGLTVRAEGRMSTEKEKK
jgi:single-strand DNA-binding protein